MARLLARLDAIKPGQDIDTSEFATKDELRQLQGSIPSVDGLVTPGDLAALSQRFVARGELPEIPQPVDVSNFATRQEVAEHGQGILSQAKTLVVGSAKNAVASNLPAWAGNLIGTTPIGIGLLGAGWFLRRRFGGGGTRGELVQRVADRNQDGQINLKDLLSLLSRQPPPQTVQPVSYQPVHQPVQQPVILQPTLTHQPVATPMLPSLPPAEPAREVKTVPRTRKTTKVTETEEQTHHEPHPDDQHMVGVPHHHRTNLEPMQST